MMTIGTERQTTSGLIIPEPVGVGINPSDDTYAELVRYVLNNGIDKGDRTGTGTKSVFGYQSRFDLSDYKSSLLTTKRMHLRSIIHELLWFISGDTNVRTLQQKGVTIWDEWANENGELGPVYGAQWRRWGTPDGGHVDQLKNVIEEIKENPDSRRLVVSAWNVADLGSMALPPCHLLYQFYVAEGRLSCQMYQRSGDIFLGVPFNIAQYAMLTQMIARYTGLQPGELIHVLGDAHLYRNHTEQAIEQLKREPFPPSTVEINPNRGSIFDLRFKDIKIPNYQHHPTIRADVNI